MNRYGLIGYPLGHSFSAAYFAAKFEREGVAGCRYENFPIEAITQVERLVQEYPDLRGFNVTIPYKEAILPHLDVLSAEAQAIGAVNCVKITPQGRMGYNTDTYGFTVSLLKLLGGKTGAAGLHALVLGTGGSSKAVRYALEKLEIPYRSVSRTAHPGGLTYQELKGAVMASHRLIINTTPLGMSPNSDSFPDIPYRMLTPRHFLFDLVYNPSLTRFMEQGREYGAAVQNGYEMLVAQAEKSWEIWNT